MSELEHIQFSWDKEKKVVTIYYSDNFKIVMTAGLIEMMARAMLADND